MRPSADTRCLVVQFYDRSAPIESKWQASVTVLRESCPAAHTLLACTVLHAAALAARSCSRIAAGAVRCQKLQQLLLCRLVRGLLSRM